MSAIGVLSPVSAPHCPFQEIVDLITFLCKRIAALIQPIFEHLENAEFNKKIEHIDRKVAVLTKAREKETAPEIRSDIHKSIMESTSTKLALQISNACGKALEQLKEVDKSKLQEVVRTLKGENSKFIAAIAELPAEIREAWNLVVTHRALTRLPADLTSMEQIEQILNENKGNPKRIELAIAFFERLIPQAKGSTPEVSKAG